MSRTGAWVLGLVGLAGLALVAGLLLACMGAVFPLDFLCNLVVGWVMYCYQVLPQVRPNLAGIVTALVCLGLLAAGMHLFFRWLYAHIPSSGPAEGATARTWPLRWTFAILGLVVLMFVAGISAVGMSHQVGWLLNTPEPLLDSRWIAPLRIQATNDLKQIGLAMQLYEDATGALPPAASRGPGGEPLLSWRVLILPYLEEGSLYNEFRLDEPWDSPHNLRLLPRMPKLYRPKSADRRADSQSIMPHGTSYQVFTGKGTAFEGQRGLSLKRDFPDGTSNTFLVVESAELVPWTKPVDLPYHPRRPLPALGHLSPKFFLALMANGSVERIELSATKASLRARITRNGGEVP